MPPEGRAALLADEITVMKLWIAAGASAALPVAAIKGAPKPVAKVEFPQIDEAAVAHARAPLAEVVKELQARFPGVLAYESRGSADLQINASLLGHSFGDEALGTLVPLRERIVWADLSGTSVSDVSAPALAGWEQLRLLRLSNTRVSDKTIRALATLDKLQTLVVVGTAVTEQSFTALRGKNVRIYDAGDIRSGSHEGR